MEADIDLFESKRSVSDNQYKIVDFHLLFVRIGLARQKELG
jgi:hypothetical protein